MSAGELAAYELEPFAEAHLAGVVDLCRALGWPSYADASAARAALSAPGAVTWVAVRGGRVIGLVHLLTNGLVHAHLSLIGVLPGHRRQGLARELVTNAFRAGGGKWLDLCSEPGSEPFYRSFLHEQRAGFRIHPGERRASPAGVGSPALRSDLEIVPFEASMSEPCERLLRALPEWFGIPESNAEYIRSLGRLTTFVARVRRDVVGFIALEQPFPESAENHVLAVHPELHRRGIGRALVAHSEAWLRARGAALFHVKTLAPSDPYPPYARTRAFYAALGFRPLFETTALWGPENPALVMAKPL